MQGGDDWGFSFLLLTKSKPWGLGAKVKMLEQDGNSQPKNVETVAF